MANDPRTPSDNTSFKVMTLKEAGEAVAHKVMREHRLMGDYMLELAWEALLELAHMSGNAEYRDYVLKVSAERGLFPASFISYKQQPFNFLTFELYRATQNRDWLPVFVEQTHAWKQKEVRTREGAVTHPRGAMRGGGHAVLIDSLQCYASRMAAAGEISGDAALFEECVEQIGLHRQILRSPENGLWSQGRGWLGRDDARLSPGAWSRGHGWLLRGLEKSLRHLPPHSGGAGQVKVWLRELADALLGVQTSGGMWHTLLHRPPAQSPPDSSGTAMIAFHLKCACVAGWLPETSYLAAAQRALDALPTFVDENGMIQSASPGPGPLESETPWLVQEFPPGDPHGTFAILFAATVSQ